MLCNKISLRFEYFPHPARRGLCPPQAPHCLQSPTTYCTTIDTPKLDKGAGEAEGVQFPIRLSTEPQRMNIGTVPGSGRECSDVDLFFFLSSLWRGLGQRYCILTSGSRVRSTLYITASPSGLHSPPPRCDSPPHKAETTGLCRMQITGTLGLLLYLPSEDGDWTNLTGAHTS